VNSASIWRAWLINRASVGGISALVGKRAPSLPSSLLTSLEQGRYDEQSLRWLVVHQTARGEFSDVHRALQWYATEATPQQIAQMERWITSWSLQLANQDERAQAEQMMHLLSAFGDEAKVYVGLGQLYQALGDTAEAERFLREALVLTPTASGFMELGALYAEEGMLLMQTDYQTAMHLLDQAGQAFESAARLDDSVSVEAHYRLGDIYWKLGQRQDAVRVYRQAAEAGGAGHFAFLSWYYLGQIYAVWWDGGLDYDLARSYFGQALNIAATGREKATSLSGIAAAYAAQGQKSEALAAYRRALKSDPTYEPAQRAIDNLESE